MSSFKQVFNTSGYITTALDSALNGIPYDELITLCEAYKDNRAVILPCKVGTTVYFVKHGGTLFARGVYKGEIFGLAGLKGQQKPTTEMFYRVHYKTPQFSGEEHFGFDEIGKTLFWGENAEAEALKVLEGK